MTKHLPGSVLHTNVEDVNICSRWGAPVNNLQLILDMLRYKRSDPGDAEAVPQRTENHKWYLTQEGVPFSLFSIRLSAKQKPGIAGDLHATQKPDYFRGENLCFRR